MWTLVNQRDLGGRKPTPGGAEFLEALQAPLKAVAAKYGLSSGFSEFPGSTELLWCSGIVASDFLQQTGDEQIESWRAEDEAACWDINMAFDEAEQTIHVDFGGHSLLRSADTFQLDRGHGRPDPQRLELGADLQVAATSLAEHLDRMLGKILKTLA